MWFSPAIRRNPTFEGVYELPIPVAIAREKKLKRYRGEWKRNLIERENPAWNVAVGFGLEPLGATGAAWWTPARGRGDGLGFRAVACCAHLIVNLDPFRGPRWR